MFPFFPRHELLRLSRKTWNELCVWEVHRSTCMPNSVLLPRTAWQHTAMVGVYVLLCKRLDKVYANDDDRVARLSDLGLQLVVPSFNQLYFSHTLAADTQVITEMHALSDELQLRDGTEIRACVDSMFNLQRAVICAQTPENK